MIIKNTMKHANTYKKIIEFKKALNINTMILCHKHQLHNCQKCRNIKKVSTVSLQKSKTNLTDLIIANDFTYFFTFTFDPKKLDSQNHQLAKNKMDNWLSNARKTSPNLKYILVPELHKKGSIHFHLLIDNYQDQLKKTKLMTPKHQRIYNVTKWKYGFSTAIETNNKHNLANYMTKYVTKAFIETKNKKRYWASRNLTKMEKTHNVNIKNQQVIQKWKNHNIKIYDNVII